MSCLYKVGDLFLVHHPESHFALIHTVYEKPEAYHCYSTFLQRDYDVCSRGELITYTDYYTDIFRELEVHESEIFRELIK